MATADGVSLNAGDHRFRDIADDRLHLFQRQTDNAASVIGSLMGRLVTASAERLVAGAAENDNTDIPVPTGAIEGIDDFPRTSDPGMRCTPVGG